MNTYLLAYNPKRWEWTDLGVMSSQVKSGKVVEDFGVYSVEVHSMWRAGVKKRSYDHVI